MDVRDIADLHVRAMTSAHAPGERFIGASDRFYWMRDIALVLKARTPDLAKKVPTGVVPDVALRLAALFDPIVRDRLFELNKARPISSAKARDRLGWAPRPCEDTIADTARSLKAHGLV